MVNRFLKVNVGGKLFDYPLGQNLLPLLDTLADVIADPNHTGLDRDTDGNPFFDRDPEHFTTLMNFLIASRFYAPPTVDLGDTLTLINEANFWGVSCELPRMSAPWTTTCINTYAQYMACCPFRELLLDIANCVDEFIKKQISLVANLRRPMLDYARGLGALGFAVLLTSRDEETGLFQEVFANESLYLININGRKDDLVSMIADFIKSQVEGATTALFQLTHVAKKCRCQEQREKIFLAIDPNANSYRIPTREKPEDGGLYCRFCHSPYHQTGTGGQNGALLGVTIPYKLLGKDRYLSRVERPNDFYSLVDG